MPRKRVTDKAARKMRGRPWNKKSTTGEGICEEIGRNELELVENSVCAEPSVSVIDSSMKLKKAYTENDICLAISTDKYNNLQCLCKKSAIPTEYHNVCRNLIHTPKKKRKEAKNNNKNQMDRDNWEKLFFLFLNCCCLFNDGDDWEELSLKILLSLIIISLMKKEYFLLFNSIIIIKLLF